MKKQLIAKFVTGLAIAIGSAATFSQPSQAQSAAFTCGTSGGVPATIAQTSRGSVTVIRWVSAHFSGSGYNPQTRCEEVSGRFQTYYNQGVLNFITTGRMNGQNIVCVSSTNGGPCSGLLFTLKPGEQASRVVQRLFDIRAGAAGPLNEQADRYYLDMNNYLNNAPVESGSSAPAAAPAAAAPAAPASSNQPTAPSGGSAW